MKTTSRILLHVLAGTAACSDGSNTPTDSTLPCEPGVRDITVPEDAPYRLLVANRYAYWTSARLDGPKRVRRASFDTDAVETVTETTRELGSLAVDHDGAAYWTESTIGTNAGAVMVARPGSAPQVLYSVPGGLDAFGVAIDDSDVYWIVHGRGSAFTQTVFHGPKAGGTATALGSITMTMSDQSIGSLSTDGGFVYWTNGASLLTRLSRSGGAAATVIDDVDGVAAFVVADGVVYAIIRDAVASIIRVDTSATPRARSVVTTGTAARWSLALDGDRLFASTSDDRIISVPVDGGEPAVEVSENVRTAGGIAIAGDRLYWVNTATAEAGGAVRWICRM